MLTLTSSQQTWAHAIGAPIKLAALGAATLLLFRLSSPVTLSAAALATAALTLTFGTGFALTALRHLRPLAFFVAIVALWHLWLNAPTEGAMVILRLLTAVTLANLVTMTTRLSDMIATFTALARPLRHVGLNPRSLALAMALVIRFVPTMLQTLTILREAWSSRSPRRPGWRILVPATLAAIDDADHVAEALRARGGTG